MNDLPRRPMHPLPAPPGAFDTVTRKARARRTRTAAAVAGVSFAVLATGMVAALPAPSGQDRVIPTDQTPTPIHTTLTPPPTSAADPDTVAALAFIDAWRQGDAAAMQSFAADEQVAAAMSYGTAKGAPDCTTQANGQYQCVIDASSGKRVYFLVGQPGAAPGRVWWVAQYAPGS